MSLSVLNRGGTPGGLTGSIIVKGLSGTDTVTANKNNKTLIGVYKQKLNEAYVVPDGYTQLEYVETTGSQFFNTGVVCDSTLYEFNIKFKKSNSTTGVNLMCASTNNRLWPVGAFFGSATTISLAVGNSSSQHGYSVIQGNTYEYGVIVNTVNHTWAVSVDGKQVGNGTFTGNVSTNSVYLLSHNNSGNAIQTCPATLYAFTAKKDGVLIRDFVPAKRNSDGVIGLYDLVNSKFYTNAGSGNLIAGAEVPKYFYYHEITGIKDTGVWLVTATDGEKTTTQGVPIEIIGLYEIEMSYVGNYFMLYDYGDECKDVTGGWTNQVDVPSGCTGVVTKNNDNISIYVSGRTSNSSQAYAATANPVDVSDYSKLFVAIKPITGNGNVQLRLMLRNKLTVTWNDWATMVGSSVMAYPVNITTFAQLDVAQFNSAYHPYWGLDGTESATVVSVATFLAKSDDIATLCTKAGLSAPSNLATLIGDTNSITAILANETAVKFMVSKCTGDFMASFVASSACLSALEASPYKSIVTTNYHWAKFLAMVQ